MQQLVTSKQYPFKIIEGEDGKAVVEVTYNRLVSKRSPEQISAEILKYLKECAEEYLMAEVTNAVISVPAYFSNAQRQATKTAAKLAGLKVLKLITEPVAAAIHYTRNRPEEGNTSLVFDFGGGTLDVSIINVDGKNFQVVGVEGDSFLGGRDFDNILVEHFKSMIKTNFGESLLNDRLIRRLKESSVKIKKKLSTCSSYSITLELIANGEEHTLDLSLTTKEFEELAENLFIKVKHLVEKCLVESKLEKHDISSVILVGGSTRILKIRQMLSDMFGKKKIRTDINPDQAVALGAGIQAEALKINVSDLEKYKITEVTPLSLGICLYGGLMDVLIKKNSPLPIVSEPVSYFTHENNQTTALFSVFEGERKICEYNNFLGTLTVVDIPPGRAGKVGFELTFELNEDGILTATARETTTFKQETLVVSIGNFSLCDYQIKQAIDNSDKCQEKDDMFERFVKYKYKPQLICNNILYELEKIPSHVEKLYVKSKCNEFQHIMKTLRYTELDRLKKEFELFRTSIKNIVEGHIDIDFVMYTKPQRPSIIYQSSQENIRDEASGTSSNGENNSSLKSSKSFKLFKRFIPKKK